MKWVEPDLFKVPGVATQEARPGSGPAGKHCRDCVHMRRHNFTEKINYCAKGKSNRTPNGLAKTKRLAPSCWLFEQKSKGGAGQ
jgi:hypothetical protein